MLKENTIITNFQPHFHLRGKAMQVEAILPDGSTQVISYVDNFNFNWMTNYIYADDAAPAFPKGTVIHVTRLLRQHQGQQEQPRPGSVGRLRRPHGRRDGARLDERRLPDRRRIQGPVAERKAKARENHRRAAAVNRVCRSYRALPAGVLCRRHSRSGAAHSWSRARQFGSSITGAFEGWYYNAGWQPHVAARLSEP